uniref:Putative UDP-N-acetylglucosamine 2-epimerase n=1 Tax=viral metagenome TaxID=1070528 RepID=A0A6M3J192_9ZZZZ
MKTILSVVGTRPNFIKSVMISKVINDVSGFREIKIDTGQHYDFGMSESFRKEFSAIVPDEVRSFSSTNSQERSKRLSHITSWVKHIVKSVSPDIVFIYGDTDSSLCGVLGTRIDGRNIPIAHIEAGMRSYDDIPEEFNRAVIDQLSNLHFCSSTTAVNNLYEEYITGVFVGDVMLDLFNYVSLLGDNSKHDYPMEDYVLITVHRDFNTKADRLSRIVRLINELSKSYRIVFPMHPRTRFAFANSKGFLSSHVLGDSVNVIDPVGYFKMNSLIRNAKLIITDSGGLQKEAYFAKKPCVVLRDRTEWVELVEHGYVFLCNDISEECFVRSVNLALDSCGKIKHTVPYGDGTASNKIIDFVKNVFFRD